MAFSDPDWFALTELSLEPEKPIRSEQGMAFYANTIAMAMGKTDAPYVRAAWHPYDGVTVGDGGDGLVWSFSRDGGAGTITSDELVDGYDYRMTCIDLGHSQGTIRTITFQAQRSTDDAWQTVYTNASLSAGKNGYLFDFVGARVTSTNHAAIGFADTVASSFFSLGADAKIKALRITLNADNFSTGMVYIHRRLSWM